MIERVDQTLLPAGIMGTVYIFSGEIIYCPHYTTTFDAAVQFIPVMNADDLKKGLGAASS